MIVSFHLLKGYGEILLARGISNTTATLTRMTTGRANTAQQCAYAR